MSSFPGVRFSSLGLKLKLKVLWVEVVDSDITVFTTAAVAGETNRDGQLLPWKGSLRSHTPALAAPGSDSAMGPTSCHQDGRQRC